MNRQQIGKIVSVRIQRPLPPPNPSAPCTQKPPSGEDLRDEGRRCGHAAESYRKVLSLQRVRGSTLPGRCEESQRSGASGADSLEAAGPRGSGCVVCSLQFQGSRMSPRTQGWRQREERNPSSTDSQTRKKEVSRETCWTNSWPDRELISLVTEGTNELSFQYLHANIREKEGKIVN